MRHSVVPTAATWKFHNARGDVDEIEVTMRAQANTGDGVRALLVGGVGFGVLPEYQIAADVRRGALVKLCAGWIWKDVTLHVVLPSKRQPKCSWRRSWSSRIAATGISGRDDGIEGSR